MQTPWNYRTDVGHDPAASLIGYDVDAKDGGIGEVTEESTEVGNHYIVVDTGFWILDKKRLIPANAIRSIDHVTGKVTLDMTKDDVKDAPDFVPESRIHEDDGYRDAHDHHYQVWYGI